MDGAGRFSLTLSRGRNQEVASQERETIDRVTGNDPAVTDYVMVRMHGEVPQCKPPIDEQTLVEVQG
jgi:hypothetical protein